MKSQKRNVSNAENNPLIKREISRSVISIVITVDLIKRKIKKIIKSYIEYTCS